MMPFDADRLAAHLLPVDAAELCGVPRHHLERAAMERIPPALRGCLVEIELTEAGQFAHMGMLFDQVAWRAVWRRVGLPGMSGHIPVWNGGIV